MMRRAALYVPASIFIFTVSLCEASNRSNFQIPNYSDYETAPFPPPDIEQRTRTQFQIVRRLGSGKFSDVFEAIDLENYLKTVVIKCLKPVSNRKIRREIAVLQHAATATNVVRLLGILTPPGYYASNRKTTDLPTMPSLIFEKAGSQWLCHDQRANIIDKADYLSDYEIRYYLYQLLVAIDSLHSLGLMHRDIKPRNVLINRATGSNDMLSLVLVDLGLADWIVDNKAYNVRVASRHYKSPELLVGYEYYTHSIDMWGIGCILAGLLFRREPFFRGKDNLDQLAEIISVLGKQDLITYLQRYEIPVTADIQHLIDKYQPHRQPWIELLSSSCPVPSADGLDLLEKLLVYDHQTRISAKQASLHRFFDNVRNQVTSGLDA
jgi:casein kinase II subunit alpha